MTRKKPAPSDRVLRIKAESESQRLAKKVGDLEGALALERRHNGWVHNLDAADQGTIRRFLDLLDTLALQSSANRAIRTDIPKVSGGSEPPSPPRTPVWAHNLLRHQLDNLQVLSDDIATFVHRPVPVAAARAVCRRCHRPLPLAVRDLPYCPTCGADRRPPEERPAREGADE